MLEGSCHCGGVRLQVPHPPGSVTDCNCSICRRLGALWAYYPSAEVAITPIDATETYVWGDRTLAIHRCKICGCTTHWQGLGDHAQRVGVNAQTLEPEVLVGVTVRRLNGAAK